MNPGRLVFKSSKNSINLRTDEVVGIGGPIEIGIPFVMIGKSLFLSEPAIRHVQTSPIISIISVDLKKIVFRTENSIYEWYPDV